MKSLLKDRKTLYITLSIVMVCVFTLTIVYAALNAVLEITGNAEVVASSWDIRLENIQLINGSVTNNIPTIIDKTTASFYTTLKNPGDYYMFTVDVVNNGSIDAMIDSIEKLPPLTTEQAKYLNYIVEYQSGDSINSKQIVEASSFVRLKVKVALRTDVISTDLPQNAETLQLSFKVNYVQSDDKIDNISIENNGNLVKVINGDGTNTSDEICIGEECFYVMYSDEDTITLLAKYNLLVGNTFDDINGTVPLENSTGVQAETARGWISGYNAENPLIGIKSFSNTNYWSSTINSYPAYVYNENSQSYENIENYKSYLEGLGTKINEARLITIEELEELGCSTTTNICDSSVNWIYTTTYWTGTASSSSGMWRIRSDGILGRNTYTNKDSGIRPVIVIDRSLI